VIGVQLVLQASILLVLVWIVAGPGKSLELPVRKG
jgi:hypothetical protein